jgi:hypothetical protein
VSPEAEIVQRWKADAAARSQTPEAAGLTVTAAGRADLFAVPLGLCACPPADTVLDDGCLIAVGPRGSPGAYTYG